MNKIIILIVAVIILVGGYFVFVSSDNGNNSDLDINSEEAQKETVAESNYTNDFEDNKIVYEVPQCGVSFEYDSSWKISELPGSVADNVMVAVAGDGIVGINIPHVNLSVIEAIEDQKSKGCYGCGFREPVESEINGIKITELYYYAKEWGEDEGWGDGKDVHPGKFYFKQNEQVCSLSDESAPEELLMILNSLKVIQE